MKVRGWCACVLVLLAAGQSFGAERTLSAQVAKQGIPPLEAAPAPSAPMATGASRAQTTYTSRAAFQAAHGSSLPVETFENGNVPPGGVATCFSPMNAATNDPACVSPGDLLPGIEIASVNVSGANGLAMLGAGFAGNPTITVVSNYFTDSTDFRFDAATRMCGWGADLQSFFTAVPLAVSIFDPGNVLTGSYTVPSSNSGTFFGVSDDQNDIARVNIFEATGALAEGADNTEWGWNLGGCTVPVALESFVVE